MFVLMPRIELNMYHLLSNEFLSIFYSILLHICIAPDAPPQNVSGYNISSTSIIVIWDEVPEDKQHGDIIYYTVMYKNVTQGQYKSVKVVPISGNFLELKGLDKYTFYDIKVSAATTVGSGPQSNLIKVRTDEDGK